MTRRNGILFGAAATLLGALTVATIAHAREWSHYDTLDRVDFNHNGNQITVYPEGGAYNPVQCSNNNAYRADPSLGADDRELMARILSAALLARKRVRFAVHTGECASGYPVFSAVEIQK